MSAVLLFLSGIYLGGVIVAVAEHWARSDDPWTFDTLAAQLAWPVGIMVFFVMSKEEVRAATGVISNERMREMFDRCDEASAHFAESMAEMQKIFEEVERVRNLAAEKSHADLAKDVLSIVEQHFAAKGLAADDALLDEIYERFFDFDERGSS